MKKWFSDHNLIRFKDFILLIMAVGGLIIGVMKLSAQPVLIKNDVTQLKVKVDGLEISREELLRDVALLRQQNEQIIDMLRRIERRINK